MATGGQSFFTGTQGEVLWESVGWTVCDSNEAKSPSPGVSCVDGGMLVFGPEFHPHVVCQGLIWETRRQRARA